MDSHQDFPEEGANSLGGCANVLLDVLVSEVISPREMTFQVVFWTKKVNSQKNGGNYPRVHLFVKGEKVNLQGRNKYTNFSNFLPKTAQKWKNLDRGEGRIPGAPLNLLLILLENTWFRRDVRKLYILVSCDIVSNVETFILVYHKRPLWYQNVHFFVF